MIKLKMNLRTAIRIALVFLAFGSCPAFAQQKPAIIKLKVDVNVSVSFDGGDKWICTAEHLCPISVAETGTNKQHLLEITPLASEQHKIEEIIILTEGQEIVKSYKFRDKIGALEDKRVLEEQAMREEVIKKVQGEYGLTELKIDGKIYEGTKALKSELKLNTDGTFMWVNFSVDPEKTIAPMLDGNWIVLSPSDIQFNFNPNGRSFAYQIEKQEARNLTLSVGLKNGGIALFTLLRKPATEAERQQDETNSAAEEKAKKDAVSEQHLKDSLLVLRFLVGVWNAKVQANSSNISNWVELSTGTQQLEFLSDGNCMIRRGYAKGRSREWRSESKIAWKIIDTETFMVERATYRIIDGKYIGYSAAGNTYRYEKVN